MPMPYANKSPKLASRSKIHPRVLRFGGEKSPPQDRMEIR
jgi:hypothetical protein